MSALTLYKLTDSAGLPLHGGSDAWSLPNGKPGKWRSVRGELIPCIHGLHLLRWSDIPRWVRIDAVLWEAGAGKERIVEDDKVVVRRARLMRQVAVLDRRTLVTWAADCAERVLPLFEKHHKGDKRPRQVIEAARRWLAGEADIAEARAAAATAAAAAYDAAYDATDATAAAAYAAYAAAAATDAAAYAADAAYDATDATAAAAAYAAAAAVAAAYAATITGAAAARTERDWQARRLAELLGLEVEAA